MLSRFIWKNDLDEVIIHEFNIDSSTGQEIIEYVNNLVIEIDGEITKWNRV